MSHRPNAQKYPVEVIQSAIQKFEGGARLTNIARELGVSKTTVKYWLDHANKFLGDGTAESPIATRIQKRLTRETWDIIFAALKVLRKKLPDAGPKDLVQIIGELFDRQSRFGSIGSRNEVPAKVIEASEEIKVSVQKYLRKQESTEMVKEDLATTTPEQTSTHAEPAHVVGENGEQEEANGAKG